MGLSGSGKTFLSKLLQKELSCAWYNADKVRQMANDWDFSPEGRVRQANRMRTFADFEKQNNRFVICDFVCPTRKTRDAFNPDIVIWLDTISKGRFEDTNDMFEIPSLIDYKVDKFLSDDEIENISKDILRGS